jgi:hypothetical protein
LAPPCDVTKTSKTLCLGTNLFGTSFSMGFYAFWSEITRFFERVSETSGLCLLYFIVDINHNINIFYKNIFYLIKD